MAAEDNPYAAPSAVATEDIRAPLPKTGIVAMIALAIVTVGLYYPYWMFTRGRAINAWAERDLVNTRAIVGLGILTAALPVSMVVRFFFIQLPSYHPELMDVVRLLEGADGLTGLGSLIATFHLRDAMHRLLRSHQLHRPILGPLTTLMFGILYFQYRINRGLLDPVYDLVLAPPRKRKKRKKRKKREADAPKKRRRRRRAAPSEGDE